MGFSKEDKTLKRVVLVIPRWIKTLFFLVTMLISLLLFSAPVLLVIADALLPSALLSVSLPPSSLTLQTLSSNFNNYDFRSSLIDIPLISIIRSAIILCRYHQLTKDQVSIFSMDQFFTWPQNLKALYQFFMFELNNTLINYIFLRVFVIGVYGFCDGPRLSRGPYLGIATVCSVASLVFVSLKASYVFMIGNCEGGAMEVALFFCSLVLAIGHVVVAYRISCRERRKLLVYKIDIEAVTACKNGFLTYQKIFQEGRTK